MERFQQKKMNLWERINTLCLMLRCLWKINVGNASKGDFCPRPWTPPTQRVSFVARCSKPRVSSTLLSLLQEKCTAQINNPIVLAFGSRCVQAEFVPLVFIHLFAVGEQRILHVGEQPVHPVWHQHPHPHRSYLYIYTKHISYSVKFSNKTVCAWYMHVFSVGC